jgi:hypothetical protein
MAVGLSSAATNQIPLGVARSTLTPVVPRVVERHRARHEGKAQVKNPRARQVAPPSGRTGAARIGLDHPPPNALVSALSSSAASASAAIDPRARPRAPSGHPAFDATAVAGLRQDSIV